MVHSMYSQYNSNVIDFNSLPDPTKEWELEERVGEGTYGEVYAARQKNTGERVAMKIMETIHEVLEEIEEEYRVLKEINHPNLPQYHGCFLKRDPQAEDQLWLAMELCSGGSVTEVAKSQLKAGTRLKELMIGHIIKETMSALKYLHESHVMHRDVKGHNILLTRDGRIKLVDFGVSGHLQGPHGRRNTSVGTPYWMAPEVIACEQQIEYEYDVRCDTWSLGITAIELADGEPPLTDLHPMRALFRIPRNPPPKFKNIENWSTSFQDFVRSCLVKDFEKRPHIGDLFKHPFIKQVPEDVSELTKELEEMIRKVGRIIHKPDVTTKHGRLKSKRKSRKAMISTVDDLATLEILDEDIIVTQLYNRYKDSQIYTYIGDILLAVNPFTPLTIYSNEYSQKYQNAGKSENPPHVYGVADQAFQAMMHNKQNQCVVISGESGSGKTESANFLVQQLTQLGKALNRSLEERILQVNPLMEAFGNAKTVINDNSSRFGKYLEMTFTTQGKVTGARMSEYLLEKSRVIHQADGEQSFHVLYYAKAYLSHEDKSGKYFMKPGDKFRYLRDSDPTPVDVSIYKVKFKTIQHCFEIIGFKPQEVESIYSILAALLHIGNIDFEGKEAKHNARSSVVSNPSLLSIVSKLLGMDSKEFLEALTTSGIVARGETIVRNNTVEESIMVRDAMAKTLYGRLFSWIVYKTNHLLKPAKARHDKYTALFDSFDEVPDLGMLSQLSCDESTTIGILDIFGFENFGRNSFEQLCINIANEQIQYYFNQHIFAWELQEYKNEGIEGSNINFVDNRPVLDMFLSKPMGVLALLDEESHFPKATDQTLVSKFHSNIKAAQYIKPKSDALQFSIKHYAGLVEYEAENFLEKNRDRLAIEIVNILRLSDVQLVRTLFQNPLSKTGSPTYKTVLLSLSNVTYTSSSNPGSNSSSAMTSPGNSASSTFSVGSGSKSFGVPTMLRPGSVTSSQGRAQQTVATYFRYSLMDLLSKMVAGSPHFVRCIRPNIENLPSDFDHDKVLVQLRYTGVLETTRIRRLGYSHRIPIPEFLKRYYILGFIYHDKVPVNRESCTQLLNKLNLADWAIGKTKVFLKYYHIEELTRQFEEFNRKVIVAQALVRMWLQRVRFRKERQELLDSALTIQRMYRGWKARTKFSSMVGHRTNAASAIQGAVRGFLVRRRYKPVIDKRKQSAVMIQAAYRGFVTRKTYRNVQGGVTQKALMIQAAWRGFKARKQMRVMRAKQRLNDETAAVVVQKHFRAWKTKTIYQQLCMYRSQKETQLIYFGQQVELYNKELLDTMRKNNSPVDPQKRAVGKFGSSVQEKKKNERMKQLARMKKTKTPWTEEDAKYYNKIVEESSRRPAKKETKILISEAEGGYYDSIVANNVPSLSSGRHGIQDGYEEADDAYRELLAKSAANKIMANKPSGDTHMRKNESDSSLPWDAPLLNAQKQVLQQEEPDFGEYILPGWEYAQLGYSQVAVTQRYAQKHQPKKPVEEKEHADKSEMHTEFDVNDLLERLENDAETVKHKERLVARKTIEEQHRRLQMMAMVLKEYQMEEGADPDGVEQTGWAKARQSSKDGKFKSFDSGSGSRHSSFDVAENPPAEQKTWKRVVKQSSKEGKFKSFESESGSRRSSLEVAASPAAERKTWKRVVKQSSEEGKFSNTPPGTPAMKRVEEKHEDEEEGESLESERKHESYPGNPGNPENPGNSVKEGNLENVASPGTPKKNWKNMVQQVSNDSKVSTPPASPAIDRVGDLDTGGEDGNQGTPKKTWKKMAQQVSEEKKFTPPVSPAVKRLEELQGTPKVKRGPLDKKSWNIVQQSSADGRIASLAGTPVDSPLVERKTVEELDTMPTWDEVKKDLQPGDPPLEDKMPSWNEIKQDLKPDLDSAPLVDKMPLWDDVKKDLNPGEPPLEDKMPSWDDVKKDLNPADEEEKEKKSWKKMAKQTSIASIMSSSRNSPASSPKTSVVLNEPLNLDSLPALAEDSSQGQVSHSSGSSPGDKKKTFKGLAKRASATSLVLSKEVSPKKRTPPDGASPDGDLDEVQDIPDVKKSWKKMSKQASVVSSIASSPADSRRESSSSEVTVEKKTWTKMIKESSEDGRMASLSGTPPTEKKSMLGSPDGEEVKPDLEEKQDADGESVPETAPDPVVMKQPGADETDPVVEEQPGADQAGGKGKWMMVRQASRTGDFKALDSPAVGLAAENQMNNSPIIHQRAPHYKKNPKVNSQQRYVPALLDLTHNNNNNINTKTGENVVDFRSVLRKTNYNPDEETRRFTTDAPNQYDFRKVLKRHVGPNSLV
ncbi:myosin-IIIa-like isoform X3 [Lineus longissimus]|uniref:myosin-IIIa-like isoform X3 n=1 Tax=Lineus longissimus TaxID=88925 RepID=UPI00315CBB00